MTTSRDLSEKLSKAGLEISTEKYWCDFGTKKWEVILERYVPHPDMGRSCPLPAYSSDELLKVMPAVIQPHDISYCYHLRIMKRNGNDELTNFLVEYESCENLVDGEIIPNLATFQGYSLCEALGFMIEWLLQNGYHYDKEKKCIVKS